jgi:hypothetical protein
MDKKTILIIIRRWGEEIACFEKGGAEMQGRV